MNLIKRITDKFRRKPLLVKPVVSHSASKNKDWAYKDESWRNPFCQIRETATGKVIKDFGVTVHRT